MTTSLAAAFTGVPGQFELRHIPTPTPRGAEVLVRVLACTLCGSDLHTANGRRKAPTPSVLGHEIVGEIVAFGNDAPRVDMTGNALQPGDRVTWSLVASCGECFFCRRALPQKCLRLLKYGHEKMTPGRELLGGLAEHCLLVPGTSILRLPDDLPLEVACPVNCATATAAAVIEAAGDLNGACVCILGAGLLGLTVCSMAKTLGAAELLCVETAPQRREQARAFGATHAIAPDQLADTAFGQTDGRGLDAAFELSGSPAAFTAAWPCLRVGGTFVVAGAVFPSAPVELPLEQLVRRHLILRGVHNYAPRHLLAAVNFVAQQHRNFPFANAIAAWHSLIDVAAAFKAAREARCLRVGIKLA